jgi:hypothetical protein
VHTVVCVGVFASIVLWHVFYLWRVFRRIARGEVPCWRCGYCLKGLSEDGNCPECGLPDALSVSLARWDRWKPDPIWRIWRKRERSPKD